MQARLVDSSGQVREATVHLIGDYILRQPDIIESYYELLSDRILDTSVAVRKRIIKIFRDICETRADYERIPEICMRVIRRMNDEDSVKKLVAETFHALWLQPAADNSALYKKVGASSIIARSIQVLHITDTVQMCKADTLEHVESLLHTLLKTADAKTLLCAGNIINCLVHNVLTIDESLQNRGERWRCVNLHSRRLQATSMRRQSNTPPAASAASTVGSWRVCRRCTCSAARGQNCSSATRRRCCRI